MPGFLLHVGATVKCSHVGTATPSEPNPRVAVSGQPTVKLGPPWTVAGCALPSNAGGPCATAMFVSAATRVTSGGQPLLLFDSRANCAPPGTPLIVVNTQTRVTAT